ncbi:MAG: putative amino acid racemase [Motiliproteus sp.]
MGITQTGALFTPRLEIDLAKVQHNSAQLVARLKARGLTVTGVTKATLGDPGIARAMLLGGVHSIGDSRIENLKKMRQAGIDAEFILLRSPQINRVEEVVEFADISLNSELEVIRLLSEAAVRQQRSHRVLLMIELGDLREGISLSDIDEVFAQCLQLPNIHIEGIGTNLTCVSGVKPDDINMGLLSETAAALQARFDISLTTVSGGNSSSINWLNDTKSRGLINNLRLGESILQGCETLNRQLIPGLFENAFSLVAEVIESKLKPSVPEGDIAQNAFGEIPTFTQKGPIQRSIINIGHQDTLIDGIIPSNSDVEIIAASSDHLVLDSSRNPLAVGAQVRFRLNYGALLAAMTSPYIQKVFI